MREFKYNIGERLYYAGCSEEYKLANPFIVNKRKIEETTYKVDGETLKVSRHLYSPDPSNFAAAWYGEAHLTKSTKTGDH